VVIGISYSKGKILPQNKMAVRYQFILFIVFALSLGVAPSFAQNTTPNTIQVKVPNVQQTYPVNYGITNATITNMTIDSQSDSLLIATQTTGDGVLTIDLPRSLIDAKVKGEDDTFFVLEDGQDSDYNETKTATDRTLTIPFTGGTEEMEIIGTQVVPEFGTIAWMVLAIAVVSIIAISAKTTLRFN